MKELSFQEEKDIILWSLIDDVFMKAFASDDPKLKDKVNIELYITPDCN